MKKILFITYDFPYPTNTGGKNRAFNLIKHGNKNTEIHLVSFVRDDFRKEYEEELKKVGVKTITIFKRRNLKDIRNIKSLFSKKHSLFYFLYYDEIIEDAILKIIKSLEIDVVHFESYYTAFYIGKKIRDLGARQIFGTENIEHFLYKDYCKNRNWLTRLILAWEIRKIENEEKEFMKVSDINIAVTSDEAKFIKEVSNKKCELVPNGVDLKNFDYNFPSHKSSSTILFIGNFTYFPNIDAINYFYDKIFTKLPKNVKLLIIGKNAEQLRMSKDDMVETISFIHDIKEAYNRADIMVSPVRIGGGTNFKILEAMAYGVPIIADPARINSLGVQDGHEILLARSPLEYQQKIDLLLKDLNLRKKLSKNARQIIEKDYSWEKIGNDLNLIWKNLW